VKCPKCNYLGFETGDRCKHCGYDFSLLSAAETELPDYEIHPPAVDDVPVHVIDDMGRHPDPWLENRGHHEDRLAISFEPDPPSEDESLIELDTGITPAREATAELVEDLALTPDAPAPVVPFLSPPSVPADRPLPLFKRHRDEAEPLIKVPSVPRPPLAVRRTPDTPRFRPMARPVSRPSSPPILEFADEGVDPKRPRDEPRATPAERTVSGLDPEQASRAARMTAVLVDLLILLGIDVAVVYFTVRIAGLTMQEWTTLPVAPMIAFLALLKVSYLCAFTAVGGQTIGKMAAGTCVVDENGEPVHVALALRRTSAAVVSFLMFGLGFLPAFFGDHRALHDRLAGTRVVRLRSV
jgi:uncharacterized RDD family membrane protein YckC